MNKKGFILIEILVSILLLSMAGIALLKINSNQKKLYTIASNKLEFSRYISILSNRHAIDFHEKELNLYDIIKKEYTLKNDTLIGLLKRKNISYSQKYKSIINLNPHQNSTPINILIDEITLSNAKGTSKYLTVKQ